MLGLVDFVVIRDIELVAIEVEFALIQYCDMWLVLSHKLFYLCEFVTQALYVSVQDL